MDAFTIEGKVAFQDIGTGFWGIIGNDNRKWRPVNLPEEYQKEGLSLTVRAERAREDVSIFMWGQAVRIIDFIKE